MGVTSDAVAQIRFQCAREAYHSEGFDMNWDQATRQCSGIESEATAQLRLNCARRAYSTGSLNLDWEHAKLD